MSTLTQDHGSANVNLLLEMYVILPIYSDKNDLVSVFVEIKVGKSITHFAILLVPQIGASDGRHYSYPATVQVVLLDVNDNPPVFNATSSYTASISEVCVLP